MMDEGAVRGLPVYGVGDGRALGRVRHVYLDPGSGRVVALGVLPEGVAPEEAPGALDPTGAAFEVAPAALAFVAAEDVRSLGADAVMVADASALRFEAPAGEGELVALDALEGREVVAEGGGEVGRVAGALFDPATWALTGIEVGQGLLRRRSLLPAAMVRDLAADPVVVAAAADPEALRAAREEASGAKAEATAAKVPKTAKRGFGRRGAAAVATPVAEGATARRGKEKRKSTKGPVAPRGERRRETAEAGVA